MFEFLFFAATGGAQQQKSATARRGTAAPSLPPPTEKRPKPPTSACAPVEGAHAARTRLRSPAASYGAAAASSDAAAAPPATDAADAPPSAAAAPPAPDPPPAAVVAVDAAVAAADAASTSLSRLNGSVPTAAVLLASLARGCRAAAAAAEATGMPSAGDDASTFFHAIFLYDVAFVVPQKEKRGFCVDCSLMLSFFEAVGCPDARNMSCMLLDILNSSHPLRLLLLVCVNTRAFCCGFFWLPLHR